MGLLPIKPAEVLLSYTGSDSNIAAVSGPAAQHRPGTHESVVWEGQAADKAEALKCAEKADPRVDLKWMRIRYENDLNSG
jgi:hypothetical protein